jgi:MFS family permease
VTLTGIDPQLPRARKALFLAFGAQGFSLIALTSEIPTIQTQLHISTGVLALVVAVVPVIAAVGSVVAGVLVGRFGSRVVLRVAQLPLLGAIIGVGASHRLAVALPFLVVVGLMIGAVDATTNMQAVVLQRRYGRSIVLSFHGMWAVGAMTASLAASVAATFHATLLEFYVGAGVIVAPVLLAFGGSLLSGVRDETIAVDPATGKAFRLPWRPMLAICAVMALAYFADSSVSNAGGLFVKNAVHGRPWQVTAVYFSYSVPFLIGRFSGDRLTERFGGVLIGRIGALIGALGFLLVILAPTAAAALGGFAVVGLGISVMAPLCVSAAGRLDPAETGVAVARLNVFNYVGFLLGAGLVTALWSAGVPYRAGVVVPMAAAAAIFLVAFGFDERRVAAPITGVVEPAAALPAQPAGHAD